ncbi:type II secretion system protein [Kaarinaea lacus]
MTDTTLIEKTMNDNRKGLTLIELILIMTMLAIVGVMTIPQMVVAADEAKDQARWDVSVAAKNSHMALIEQAGDQPTVIAIAEQVTAGHAVPGGIQVEVDGSSYTIPTYTNSLCNEPTRTINDKVGCVGAI